MPGTTSASWVLAIAAITFGACRSEASDRDPFTLRGKSFSLSPNQKQIALEFDGTIHLRDSNNPSDPGTMVAEGHTPVFTSDGTKLVFVKAEPSKRASTIYGYTIESKSLNKLAEVPYPIFEMQLTSKTDKAMALVARVHTSYSPMAAARPHGFDVIQIDFQNQAFKPITHFNAYSMNGLNLSSDGDKAFFYMDENRQGLKPGIYEVAIGGEQPAKLVFGTEESGCEDPVLDRQTDKIACRWNGVGQRGGLVVIDRDSEGRLKKDLFPNPKLDRIRASYMSWFGPSTLLVRAYSVEQRWWLPFSPSYRSALFLLDLKTSAIHQLCYLSDKRS
jgi:hypothetical protein